jgi:ferric-dicitrate binding protein FerR (iron transport regulator)
MRIRFLASSAILSLVLAGAFSISALAQTTDEGPGPSEQPSAPMEIGTPQPPAQPPQNRAAQDQSSQDQSSQAAAADSQPSDAQSPDAQPTEAQPGGPTGEAPAKTDQGVARISFIHGDVSTQRGDSGGWSAATLNQPVMSGDSLSTGDGARTELQLDFANTLRLGPNSKATVANFTHKNIQIQLGQGLANYTVSKDSEAEPEIDTPNVAVHPAHRDGVFRIEVRPDGDTIVIVRKGEAQIATPQGSADVRVGEMATIRGDSNSAEYKISDAPDRDQWDEWNADRDHMIQNAQSWHHTNRYYTGAQDLDAYGTWRNVPDYGDVWVPNEPDGWVPYRDGNWTYEPYYGWTWVGYEPWGWAPYHYGRWLWYGGGWGWWPGPVWGWYRPFWAPAYVSFWGWGAGFGFGFGWGGWGGFGWLPLGPGDWFHPWWGGYAGRFGWFGHGWGYGRFGGFAPLHAGTRFSNVANLHDAHIGGALSTVGAGHFGAGHVTAMAATHAQIGGARMMAGNLPVVPSRASLSASGRPAAASTIRNGGSEHFFGSHNNVEHTSFQQETAHLQQTMAQNHVSGFTAGRTGGTESASRSTPGTLGKPSAGTAESAREADGREASGRETSERETNGRETDGREMSNPGRSAGSSSARAFTPPNSSNARESSSANRNGFRSFSPPSGSAARGESGTSERGTGSYWNRTAPSSSESRSTTSRGGSYADGYSRGSSSYGYSRPQLDMRQPIARSPYGGYSRGESRPSYGGYGGYHAPSYGSHAPSYGGGHSSAPSGHSSAGHSSGGGHSGGGHSGGGHSGGGGHGGGHR